VDKSPSASNTKKLTLPLKTDHQVATAIFITSSTFMPAAQELASRHGIVLLDGLGLLRRIQSQPADVQQHLLAVATEGEFWRATCVQCGTKMTLRTHSTNRTQFWACGRCHHTLPSRQKEGVA
jgi:restriction system protein